MSTSNNDEHKEKPPLSTNLKKIKEQRHLTVKELAGMAGVADSVMQGWLEGVSPQGEKGFEAIDRLATKLGLGFRELMLGKKEETRPVSIEQLFDEEEWFEDICKLKIVRLKRKRNGDED